MCMWNGKKKAVTFSFDDGVTQDIRLIELFNKYGLKGTFNINSGLLGLPGSLQNSEKTVDHNKIDASKLKEIYSGHEVAVHTLTHPRLPTLNDETVIRQVEEDRKALESLCGYPVVGMAYPCGGENNDERVATLIRENTPIRYSRTITSSHSFAPKQANMLRYNPTVYFVEKCFDEIVDKFLTSDSEEEQLLYIWGHSYEMDFGYITWEHFEDICRKLSRREDIFYGTNKEVLL